MRYACIARHRAEYAVVMMCRVLEVTRSGYYAWRQREPSEHRRADQRLRVEVRAIHGQSRGTYGSPRIHAELKSRGEQVSRKRIARLMREEEIRGKKRRRWRRPREGGQAERIAPNVLERGFGVKEVGGRDRVWVTDITYVPTRQGWLYLAVVLDLGTRKVVGWSMGQTLETELASGALEMALRRRRPGAGLLHHSDRGSQYTSWAYQELLGGCKAVASMSRKGNCWDNAVAESFFATLEVELIEGAEWQTRGEARSAIFEYIEVWYNRQRRHSSLGYLSPEEYERRLAGGPRAALPRAA